MHKTGKRMVDKVYKDGVYCYEKEVENDKNRKGHMDGPDGKAAV